MISRLLILAIPCALVAACGGGKSHMSESKSIYTVKVQRSEMGAPKSQQDAIDGLLRLTNQSRRANGRSTLILDARLARAAQYHSEQMNRAQSMTHQTPGEPDFQKRLMKQGYPQVWCAENIAQAPNALLVNRLWLESPGHRKNMMGKKYTHVGFGRSGQYWTANYAQAAGSSGGDSSMPPPATSWTGGF